MARVELFAGNQEKAVELARSIAQSESSTTITLASVANILLESGAPAEESLLLANRAIELAQQSDRELWYAQLQKAESLNCLGDFEEALAVGKSALASVVKPSTVMAVLRSLLPLGHLKEALQLAESAVAQFPEAIEIKAPLVFLLKLAGRDKECIKLVKNMGAKAAIMVTPLLDMGDCLVRAKQYEQALKCYRTVRKNLEGKKILEDYYIRAVKGEVTTIVNQGNQQQALSIINAFEENYLINSPLWLLKAALIADMKLYSKGVSLAVERAKVAPDDPQAAYYKAECFWRLKKPTDALSAIDLAGKLEGKATSSTLKLKACIMADMSRYEEAMDLLVNTIEVQAESGKQVELEVVALAAQWLPKTTPPPLVGLHLGAIWLGATCLQQGCSTEAKKILKILSVLDWTSAQQTAKAGNCESLLAAAIMQKAQDHLEQRSCNHPTERLSLEDTQRPQTSTVLENLMRHVLYTTWPSTM